MACGYRFLISRYWRLSGVVTGCAGVPSAPFGAGSTRIIDRRPPIRLKVMSQPDQGGTGYRPSCSSCRPASTTLTAEKEAGAEGGTSAPASQERCGRRRRSGKAGVDDFHPELIVLAAETDVNHLVVLIIRYAGNKLAQLSLRLLAASYWMRPSRSARTPASVRDDAPILRRTRETCVLTVSGLMPRATPISLSDFPCTTRCSTASCRGVSL